MTFFVFPVGWAALVEANLLLILASPTQFRSAKHALGLPASLPFQLGRPASGSEDRKSVV